MINIVSTRDSAIDQGVKVLVYGRAGVGKTYMARTCPAPIILSAEAGLLSLRDLNLPYITVESVAKLREVYDWLKGAAEAKQFKTVYIDSISEIAEVILENAKKINKDPRQAYGELATEATAAIRCYRDLPGRHVVTTAKQDRNEDQVTKMTMYGPSMPGKLLAQALPYLFDEVFRLGVAATAEGKSYRFLQTAPDLQYDAKDRSGSLDSIEPPDMTLIFDKILGVK